MVRWVWVWLTRGHISERNVLIVQGASGVLAAMVLYWTLRRFRVRGAVIIASASAFIPSLVLMERAILTESLELLFLVVGIYAISVLLTTVRLLVVLVSAPLGVAAMSLASALHPSALAGAIASDVLIAYLVIRHMRGRGHKLWRASLVGLSSAILAVATSIAMLVPMSHVYEHQYKMRTFNPIENITLAFRWSPIIPCSDSPHYEPLARYVINRACHLTDWVDPPGMNLRPTFSGATQYSIAHSPGTFARADKQIGAVVHHAILSNVPIVASEMWRSIKWQYLYAESHFVFHRASFYITPKMLSLPYFSTASRWFDSHTRPTVHDQFPAHLWSQSN
jgi:hypothetical protein